MSKDVFARDWQATVITFNAVIISDYDAYNFKWDSHFRALLEE